MQNAHCRLRSNVAILSVVAILFTGKPAAAEVIEVSPGEGALAAALASANPGDTIRLAAGRYEESCTVPGEITIEGVSSSDVTLVPTDYAVLRMDGPNVVIRNVGFEHAGESRRAISGEQPIRVENCRFTKFPEALGLRMAPLVDVVLCEFRDCDIGVRAIGGTAPTVWGCAFNGGKIGVFSMDGASYIVNNLFRNMQTGVLLVGPDHPHGPIVRHNVFAHCKKGIEMKGEASSFPNASIRNSVFVECDTALAGPSELLAGTSHCAFNDCNTLGIDLADRYSVQEAIGLTVKEDGTIAIAKQELLREKGIRTGAEPEGTVHDIGLVGITRPGVEGVPIENAPRNRFAAEPFIVNATSEQYLYMQLNRLRMRQQALMKGEHGMIDVQSVVTPHGEERDIKFDVNRYYGDSAFLTP